MIERQLGVFRHTAYKLPLGEPIVGGGRVILAVRGLKKAIYDKKRRRSSGNRDFQKQGFFLQKRLIFMIPCYSMVTRIIGLSQTLLHVQYYSVC